MTLSGVLPFVLVLALNFLAVLKSATVTAASRIVRVKALVTADKHEAQHPATPNARLLLQLHNGDEVLSKKSDDNEDVEPDTTDSSSQDNELNDEAPFASANTEAVADWSSSIVTPSLESFGGQLRVFIIIRLLGKDIHRRCATSEACLIFRHFRHNIGLHFVNVIYDGGFVVENYNKSKRLVDLTNQMAAYSSFPKRTKTWYLLFATS
ncbi:hypothetical protein KIN20_031197 [Parelaphostrongylus tenuis]|uniref:Uncharacterized protein n=1 Tax=Parelaphostrongylus tenuis TaxID=148309 RepID=A0AAD5WH40_PARTN|nr:hypothetical protein KIN20_031197 [Parelaphostrongylus tenuis]